MSFRVSGKNIDIGEVLRGRIGERVAEALGKYFDGGYSGHATVAKDGFGFRTECALHLDSGITLQAEATAADAYASADQAAIRIEKRLRRYKRRLKDRQVTRPDGPPDIEDGDEEAEFCPVIIAESTTALKRLSVSEAVLELDLTGTAVMVFRHAGHGRVNIVYRRPDGHIGWIDPPDMETRLGTQLGTPLGTPSDAAGH
jgi:ribosomal subunit interface protein